MRERVPRDDGGELPERGEEARQLLGGSGEPGGCGERVRARAGAWARARGGGGGADGAFEQPRRVEENWRQRVRQTFVQRLRQKRQRRPDRGPRRAVERRRRVHEHERVDEIRTLLRDAERDQAPHGLPEQGDGCVRKRALRGLQVLAHDLYQLVESRAVAHRDVQARELEILPQALELRGRREAGAVQTRDVHHARLRLGVPPHRAFRATKGNRGEEPGWPAGLCRE